MYVDVSETDGKEACPSAEFVFSGQTTDAIVELMAARMLGKTVQSASDEMPEGVTTEDVATDEDDIYQQNDRSEADAEPIFEPKRFPHIPDEERPNDVGEPKKLAMQILGNQGKVIFAPVRLARLADLSRLVDQPRTLCNTRRGNSSR